MLALLLIKLYLKVKKQMKSNLTTLCYIEQGETLVEAVVDGENIMEKSYLVVSIEEQNFGCEGRPDGMEPMVDVVLEQEDGTRIRIKEKDKKLYELDINEGDSVFLRDGCLTKQLS